MGFLIAEDDVNSMSVGAAAASCSVDYLDMKPIDRVLNPIMVMMTMMMSIGTCDLHASSNARAAASAARPSRRACGPRLRGRRCACC